MNPDVPFSPDDAPGSRPSPGAPDAQEARLTALLLGELSAQEAADVRAALAASPELQRLHARLEVTLGLLRSAVTPTTSAAPASGAAAVGTNPQESRLSAERREQLLAAFRSKVSTNPPAPASTTSAGTSVNVPAQAKPQSGRRSLGARLLRFPGRAPISRGPRSAEETAARATARRDLMLFAALLVTLGIASGALLLPLTRSAQSSSSLGPLAIAPSRFVDEGLRGTDEFFVDPKAPASPAAPTPPAIAASPSPDGTTSSSIDRPTPAPAPIGTRFSRALAAGQSPVAPPAEADNKQRLYRSDAKFLAETVSAGTELAGKEALGDRLEGNENRPLNRRPNINLGLSTTPSPAPAPAPTLTVSPNPPVTTAPTPAATSPQGAMTFRAPVTASKPVPPTAPASALAEGEKRFGEVALGFKAVAPQDTKLDVNATADDLVDFDGATDARAKANTANAERGRGLFDAAAVAVAASAKGTPASAAELLNRPSSQNAGPGGPAANLGNVAALTGANDPSAGADALGRLDQRLERQNLERKSQLATDGYGVTEGGTAGALGNSGGGTGGRTAAGTVIDLLQTAAPGPSQPASGALPAMQVAGKQFAAETSAPLNGRETRLEERIATSAPLWADDGEPKPQANFFYSFNPRAQWYENGPANSPQSFGGNSWAIAPAPGAIPVPPTASQPVRGEGLTAATTPGSGESDLQARSQRWDFIPEKASIATTDFGTEKAEATKRGYVATSSDVNSTTASPDPAIAAARNVVLFDTQTHDQPIAPEPGRAAGMAGRLAGGEGKAEALELAAESKAKASDKANPDTEGRTLSVDHARFATVTNGTFAKGQTVERLKELTEVGQVANPAEEPVKLAKAMKNPAPTDSSERQRRLMDAEQEDLVKQVPARRPAPNAPVPQPEQMTAENAVSTFSLNVSDVSFQLAAASLAQGRLPDAAGIRVEEFINAIDYHDPEPAPGRRIAFHAERARYPFAHQRDLLRLSVKTAASGRAPGRPLNLVLLLDNSGSMERADRVRIRQECLRVLATQLQPNDHVSVVSFARTARLWVDGLPGTQASELSSRVDGLTPEGGTNLEEALRLAYETARRHRQTDTRRKASSSDSVSTINRVVLLTDGAANLGDVTPESLRRLVETGRTEGIALDCFGIGWDDYNDDLLEALARNGDGRYGFINSPAEAASGFAGQLAGALNVAASDVKVQVEFNPRRVTTHRQLGYAKHQLTAQQFRDNTVDAAEIGAAESGNALYVIQVNPAGDGPIGTARVRFKIPGTSDYEEQSWTLPYTGSASTPALDQAPVALRLAGTAAAFAEWLAASPHASDVQPARLLPLLTALPSSLRAEPRTRQLEGMIRQAASAAGQ